MEICAGDEFVQPDNQTREGYNKGPQSNKRPRKNEERVRHFHTTTGNILIEIKGNPC